MKQRFGKTKLSLALSAVLVAGAAVSTTTGAVTLENNLRLGDAAIFQYYTAKDDWQTFFRLINTSEDAVVVKVRFREAANSREVLDFEVALSPWDMWSGWTDRDAMGTGEGPGIRTNDTSCVFPLPGTSPPSPDGTEGFERVNPGDPDSNLIAARFKDRAFTGVYDDGTAKDSLMRRSEGYFEVIGIAKYDCDGSDDDEARFCENVTHNPINGKPENCQIAYNTFFGDDGDGDDVPNVLATNAYLVNVPSGQGAGYDPDMLWDCATRDLEDETIATDTNPDLDSCDALNFGVGDRENNLGVGPVAVNQRFFNGTAGSSTVEFLRADVDNDGAFTSTIAIDLNGDDQCTGAELTVSEADVPQAVFDAVAFDADPAANDSMLDAFAVGGCDYRLVNSAGSEDTPYLTQVSQADVADVVRIKQKGQFTGVSDPDFPRNQFPVTGGVDGVSQEIMRTSVINEWAASSNPAAIVTDYFTQWVLTFPTKHYYVDLWNDTAFGDDISPTLVDVGDAFAPFTNRYDGRSCERFVMDVFNREERFSQFTSPEPSDAPALCWETNVLTFNERYNDRGLDSNFNLTVPEIYLPRDFDGSPSERGWAEMVFTGRGASVGLTEGGPLGIDAFFEPVFGTSPTADFNPWLNWYGLPVTGFLFSVYNTGAAENNHTAINAHKYTESRVLCRDNPRACAEPPVAPTP